MAAIGALTLADLCNAWRDSFVRFMLLYPLILGLLLRWLIPFVAAGLADLHDVYQYFPLLIGLFGFVMPPMLMGVAVGFLLLDEKDARTLLALRVTPMTSVQYLTYRLLVPVVVSFVSSYVVLGLMGLLPVLLAAITPLALLGALTSPLYALLLASLAENKVQGLALMKGLGILVIGPVVAWWVPLPWQWLLGLLPTFWPMKAYWVLSAGGAVWPLLVAGVAVLAVYLVVLLRHFEWVMARLAD